MKKALKRMAAAALVTLSVLRGGDAFAQNAVYNRQNEMRRDQKRNATKLA
nr:hypothetical protein [Alistipes shahii]